MKIMLNGKEYELEDKTTIQKLIERLKVNTAAIVVEHNLNIVKKHLYPEVILQENDAVEILTFLGGG